MNITNKVFTFFFILIFFNDELFSKEFKPIIELGLNISTFKEWIYDEDTQYQVFPSLSILIDKKLNNNISLLSGMRYYRIGNDISRKWHFSQPTHEYYGSVEAVMYNQYISVPIKLKYIFLKRQKTFICSGIDIGYLINEKFKGSQYTNKILAESWDISTTKTTSKINLCFLIGIGNEFSFNKCSCYFQLIYNHGLTEIHMWDKDFDRKTREIYFSFGIRL